MNHVLEINESAMLSASKLLNTFNSENPLTDIAAEIAGLNRSKAVAVAGLLSERGEEVGFCLGGVLKVISDNGWFEGHESFDEFVFETCNFHVRQAQHLMRTYSYLVDKKIPWVAVKALGWTKLRLLVNAGKLTAENAADWVTRAAGKSMTVRALDNELKFVPEQPKPQTTVLNLVQPSSFTTSTSVCEPTGGGAGADEDVETENPDDDEQQAIHAGFQHAESDNLEMLKELMLSFGPYKVQELFEELFPDMSLMKGHSFSQAIH